MWFSLAYAKIRLFFLLLREVLTYTWSKFKYKGRMKIEDERDITGAVVIVTGANSGIGKSVAYEFAKRRARVVMACRDLVAGKNAIEEHRKRAIDEGIRFPLELVLLHLDLIDFGSVRKFCAEVISLFDKVDILVNNAGVFDTSGKLKRTKTGLEEHIVVNYLSQFLLTNLLFDIMKGNGTSSPSRIIDVSSSLLWFGILADDNNIMLENQPRTTGICNALPYGLSKFYISMFSKEMSRRIPEKHTLFYSMCPGYVDTGMFRSFNRIRRRVAQIMIALVGVTPSVGCDTILFLALSKVPPKSGLFFRFDIVHKAIEKHLEANHAFGLKLIKRSAEVLGISNYPKPDTYKVNI